MRYGESRLDTGLLKGGLVFNLVIQILGTIIFFAVAAAGAWGTVKIAGAISSIHDSDGGSIQTEKFAMGLTYGTMSFLWVIFGFYLIVLVFNIFALRHVNQVIKGETEFKTGLLYLVGILALFLNFIGGILILIGISNVKKSLEYAQPRYRDERPPRRPEPRDRRDDRWEERRPRDRRDDYDDYDDYPPRRSDRY